MVETGVGKRFRVAATISWQILSQLTGLQG